MLVFVDESGDPGMRGRPGSSKYFIVAAVIFSDAGEASRCEDAIGRLRRTLNFHERHEFHFNKSSRRVREQFLRAVASHAFTYHVFAMNKGLLWSRRFFDAAEFYRYTAGMVLDNARSHLTAATVVIDESGGQSFRTALARHLKASESRPAHCIKRVKMQASHANDLLQLADMVCGAVARSLNESGPDGWHYREIIRAKEARVRWWPKP